MDVVIVGITNMGSRVCVGALSLDDWSSLRLTDGDLHGWSPSEQFIIGDVWKIRGSKITDCRPPHVEDFSVSFSRRIGPYTSDLKQDIIDNVNNIAHGGFHALYQGCLHRNSTGTHCIKESCVPAWSTQFWLPSMRLTHDINNPKPHYTTQISSIGYVGRAAAIDVIPARSLVRVSLARWWAPVPTVDEACYLQISGWWL